MSDLPTGLPAASNPGPANPGPMQDFAGLPWNDQSSREWAGEAATRINAYDQQKQIADANDAAGANLVGGIDRFRRGLLTRTAADPHFVHTALDLVPPTIGGIVANHPNLSPEDKQTHYDALTGDIQNQLALSAVQGLAGQSAPAAHAMMADPRISGLLSDEDKGGLTSYIGLQHMARTADGEAQQQMAQRQQQVTGTAATLNHAEGLYDPNTDAPSFQPGWAGKVMADNRVQPADKMALMQLYGRMQQSGDAPASDPVMVQKALAGGMSHTDTLNEAGGSLRLADALDLSHAALPMTTQDRARYAQVADVIQQARGHLYGPNGENGAAGHAAWARFVNWMLPTMRMGGAGLMDPNAHPLNWIGRFAPTGDDVVPNPPENRPSLGKIFGR